jgi:hypothetical protein
MRIINHEDKEKFSENEEEIIRITNCNIVVIISLIFLFHFY